ncbi:MAG: PEP-CTERM sorting domain-containing protein, partial [Candidatus Poribacteria bacterium]
NLIDDGKWRSYAFNFVAPVTLPYFGGGTSNNIRLMFEDFSGSGGVAGDAFFDNVQLSAVNPVPEPSSFWLVLCALPSLLLFRKRRRSVQ